MNNNNHECTAAKCHCGRYMTLGELVAGVRTIGYKCPDCTVREYSECFNR